jgi:hypothetical protein
VLPDLPLLKTDLQEVLNRYLRRQMYARLGVFNQGGKHIIHEGDRMRIWRADGDIDDSQLKAASAELILELGDIPALTLQERVRRIDELADKMAEQMSKQLFGALNEVLERAGQTMDRKGLPLDAETVLAALESIDIDFDEAGRQSPLSLVVHPSMGERARQALEQLERDPAFKARHDALLAKKKAEWRDREAARKLVG